ncbi:11799_t:CDS:2, partial [Acaulospora colombiana]
HSGKYNKVLDVATDTGHVAYALTSKFAQVHATDLSRIMLSNALHTPNIRYSVSTADLSQFLSSMFDLVTIGQAAHWFRIQEFFNEANIILIPNGTLENASKFSDGHGGDELGKCWEDGRQVMNDLNQSFILSETLFKDIKVQRKEKEMKS